MWRSDGGTPGYVPIRRRVNWMLGEMWLSYLPTPVGRYLSFRRASSSSFRLVVGIYGRFLVFQSELRMQLLSVVASVVASTT